MHALVLFSCVVLITISSVGDVRAYEACDFSTQCVSTSAYVLPPLSDGRSLHIPALSLDTHVTIFPLVNPTWEISPWEREAGHFEYTAWVDAPGNIVIGAHSRYPSGVPGIFHQLDTLQVGDLIYIRDANIQKRYIVQEVKTVDYQDLSVLYPTTESILTLITCSIPSYIADQNKYEERIVIVAVEV